MNAGDTPTATVADAGRAGPGPRGADRPLQRSRDRDGAEALFQVQDLVTEFSTLSGTVTAVNGASYRVDAGRTLGVVGESGSGKSVTVLSALGLLGRSGRVTGGQAWFDGNDLVAMPEGKRDRLRGGEIGMIFQDPMTALNPVMTIGAQIDESIRRHHPDVKKPERRARILDALQGVGIPSPKDRANQYPHQFSGGMRQRAMIAMAMINQPRLLICDEPTTAVDVTVQAQILELLRNLQDEYGTALVLITHDLGVVAEMADDVVVMYAGKVVESAPVDDVFHAARHPYTVALLESLPRVDQAHDQLASIPGSPPDPRHLPEGCAFRVRCPLTGGRSLCRTDPPMEVVGPDHRSACHFHEELAGPREERSAG